MNGLEGAGDLFQKLEGDALRARDHLLARWGLEYMAGHPGQTARNGWRKIWVAISGQLSPARGPATDAVYALVYVPVHLLAAIGLWRSRGDWQPHALVYLVFLSFFITTAIFWAHTSQKSCLDVFLFVYAASVLQTFPRRSRLGTIPLTSPSGSAASFLTPTGQRGSGMDACAT